jgi:hypothetical protein
VREAAKKEATSMLGYRANACDSAEQAARILESQSVDVVLQLFTQLLGSLMFVRHIGPVQMS